MMIKILVIIFAMPFLILNASSCFALNEDTHKALNEAIAKNPATNAYFNDYLNRNLGFSSGVEEEINGQRIYKWLGDGGYYEDIPHWYMPYLRSFNHFNNPLNNQGFNAVGLGWYSSVQWALMPAGGQIPGGHYSWHDARDYYRAALTSSSKAERDTNFAETFRGVGQLMHLVEDASVPAHTRNDGHLKYNYETYVNKYKKDIVPNAVSNPAFFTGPINSIASFIDTNQYNGANPSASSSQGLSEYTNANFFSEGTIFSGDFPYPRETSVELYYAIVPDVICIGIQGLNCFRPYLRKVRDGETINHFAVPGRLYKYLGEWPDIQNYFISLDDMCYRDYASKLIPRAVGYSAGLINYFFRGKIDMEKDSNGNYIIKNLSNEDMSGAFSLYYDDKGDNRSLITSWNLSIGPGGKSGPVGFTEPISPEPKEKGKYVLVFNGALGPEQGAVAGKVVSLERKRWEDWDEFRYEFLGRTDNGAQGTFENAFLHTGSRSWDGWLRYGSGHRPGLRGGGVLQLVMSGANIQGFAEAYFKTSGPGMSGKDCKIKINVPYAHISGKYNVIWIGVRMTDGVTKYSRQVTYGIAEGDTSFWDSVYPGVPRIFIGTGETERDVESDLQRIMSAQGVAYSGKWYIKEVFINVWIWGWDYITDGGRGYASLVIDYIDFVCNE